MSTAMLLLTIILPFLSSSAVGWTLVNNINASNWAQRMVLETNKDNHEYVNFLTQDAAVSSGLIRNQNGQLYLGVDSDTVLDPSNGAGRNSVRLRSTDAYNAGILVIGDFSHIPANVCGIWPGFWLVGPAWPQDGEIDILEGVNQMSQNQITIHSLPNCKPGVGSQGETGQRTGMTDCGDQGGFIGCGVFNTKAEGWGSAFNNAGGGVYATIWTTDAIQVWSWKNSDVPWDIKLNIPNPANWGTPVANWVGCSFGTMFDNMKILINTAFCGDWAGQVWKSGSCSSAAPDCTQYVAANPQVYKEAYWLINSIKVYSQ